MNSLAAPVSLPPFGPYPMTDELNQAFLFLSGSSSDDLWFACFLLEVFVPNKYVRAIILSFPIRH